MSGGHDSQGLGTRNHRAGSAQLSGMGLPAGRYADMGTLRGWGGEVLEISGLSQYGGVGAEAESPKH